MGIKARFSRQVDSLGIETKDISMYLPLLSGSGLKKSGGRMWEEYNTKFKGRQRFRTYKEMANDSTVFRMTQAIELIATGCDYSIEPYIEEGKEVTDRDKEISDFVSDSLFKMMGKTWTDFVTEVFTFIQNGYSIFEISFREKGGKQYIRLSNIDPQSVEQFLMEDNEEGVLQISDFELDRGINKGKSNTANIPAWKLVQFKGGGVTGNFDGVSLYRKIARDRYIKDKIQTYEGIRLEKLGVPPMKVKIPQGTEDELLTKYVDFAQNLRVSEDNFVVVETNDDGDPLYDYEFMDMKISSNDPKFGAVIERYEQNIMDSFFETFLYLGKSEKGSYGMASTSVDFFLLGVESLIKRMVETINNFIIPKIVMFNYGDVECPTLTYQKTQLDLTQWADVISKLKSQKLITDSLETERAIREKTKLPEIEEEDFEEGKSNDGKDINVPSIKPKESNDDDLKGTEQELSFNHSKIFEAQDGISNRQKKKLKKMYSDGNFWRPLTFAERKVNLSLLKNTGDRESKKLKKGYKLFVELQMADLLKQVKRVIDSNSFTNVKNIKPKYASHLSKDVSASYKQMFELGKSETAQQLGVEAVVTGKSVDKAIKDQADNMSSQVSKKAGDKTKNTLYEKISKNAGIATLKYESIKKALEEELEKIYKNAFSGVDTVTINGALNTGGGTTMERNKDKIYAVQYSSIIDNVTSNRCLSLDGSVVRYASSDYKNFSPPQHIGCRSIWVAIDKKELFKPEITGVKGVPVKNTITSQELLKTPVLGNSNLAIKQVEKEIDRRENNVDKLEKKGGSKQDINQANQKIDSLQKSVDEALQ